MSNYFDNQRSTIVALLQSQELNLKMIKAKLDATMFTLYYAQGAKITAYEKLESVKKSFASSEALKEQVVLNNNLSVNVLNSAIKENSYVAQSVTNSANSAANVEAVTNAIVRLAANIGSIYNIIMAQDSDSEISQQCKRVNDLINKTAHGSELVSQQAMEVSALVAEISSASVYKQVMTVNSSMDKLLKEVSHEYEKATESIVAKNTELANSETKEKVSEGKLLNIYTEYLAAQNAYQATKKALNYNLSVQTDSSISKAFSVSFDLIKNAFAEPLFPPQQFKTINFPVEQYYIIVVKEKKKSTFSISIAESLISKKTCIYKVQMPKKETETIEIDISIESLYDSDGENLLLGENYVVFLMGVYLNQYKKTLHNFEDILSAPSHPFKITQAIKSPDYNSFTFDKEVFGFKIDERLNNNIDVEYRCMFLPADDYFLKDLPVESSKSELSEFNFNTQGSSSLIFNAQLAEQITKANYSVAEKSIDVDQGMASYQVQIKPENTDNFGNPLIKGSDYIPVVLAISNASLVLFDPYASTISDYTSTEPIVKI